MKTRPLLIAQALLLSGCSSLTGTVESKLPPERAPPPVVSQVVATIRTVAGQYKLSEPIAYAGPIEAPATSIVPWIICLKGLSDGKPSRQTIALFFDKNSNTSSRISVIADRCDGQAYQALPKT